MGNVGPTRSKRSSTPDSLATSRLMANGYCSLTSLLGTYVCTCPLSPVFPHLSLPSVQLVRTGANRDSTRLEKAWRRDVLSLTPGDLCPVGPSRFPPARSDGCDARIPSARRSAALYLLAGVCPPPAKACHVPRPGYACPSCSSVPCVYPQDGTGVVVGA